jgi:hypothetical protein
MFKNRKRRIIRKKNTKQEVEYTVEYFKKKYEKELNIDVSENQV